MYLSIIYPPISLYISVYLCNHLLTYIQSTYIFLRLFSTDFAISSMRPTWTSWLPSPSSSLLLLLFYLLFFFKVQNVCCCFEHNLTWRLLLFPKEYFVIGKKLVNRYHALSLSLHILTMAPFPCPFAFIENSFKKFSLNFCGDECWFWHLIF